VNVWTGGTDEPLRGVGRMLRGSALRNLCHGGLFQASRRTVSLTTDSVCQCPQACSSHLQAAHRLSYVGGGPMRGCLLLAVVLKKRCSQACTSACVLDYKVRIRRHCGGSLRLKGRLGLSLERLGEHLAGDCRAAGWVPRRCCAAAQPPPFPKAGQHLRYPEN
jgi:hypothetical protein